MPIKSYAARAASANATFYTWPAKFGGMGVLDAKRLKELESAASHAVRTHNGSEFTSRAFMGWAPKPER